jgi:hypothetical protein
MMTKAQIIDSLAVLVTKLTEKELEAIADFTWVKCGVTPPLIKGGTE